MVAPTTPRLAYVPQVNLSRMYLHRAADALNAGRLFEAGVLLREAIRRQLVAECNWHGILPTKKQKLRSPMALLHILHDAKHCGYVGFTWTTEIIETCNKLAHGVPVRARLIADSIAVWHTAIDHDPCGEPKNRPTKNAVKPAEPECDCDCDDDDDGADWWKGGGV